ncbi:MAG TPA: glycine cleavage T C-terminal barrel domain-containing protein, partial [Stellaceae bacterium]|nr:glycine cleavage T C-terminal barrel domain-containing protein [Stellaceae bacterium]
LRPPARMVGHVTSSYWSANLGRSIALALVRNGRARIGDSLFAPTADGRNHKVAIVPPRSLDPVPDDG